MPYDFQKILTDEQTEINRLFDFAERHLTTARPNNNNYFAYATNNGKLKIEFKKVFENGSLVGFRHAEIGISPHYHKNNYLHNADFFSPEQAIKSLKEIYCYLGISEENYQNYKVVVSEFGLNIIPPTDTRKIIDYVGFYRRKRFVTRPDFPNFKISETDKTKQFKIYYKGVQFPEINANTLRIEIRLKKSGNIAKRTGINHIGDLLQSITFSRFFEVLINDFEHIFFCDEGDYFSALQSKIQTAQNRNKWLREKGKFLKNRPHLNAIKSSIKGQLIDTFLSFSESAKSPQRTPINTGKHDFQKDDQKTINGDYAPPNEKKRVCEVTKLDISMQKKSSKFLCSAGLNYYHHNHPEIYQRLANEYLTANKRNADLQTQIYYLAHNIRNTKTNPNHNPRNNRQRFEERNYHPHQLQLF